MRGVRKCFRHERHHLQRHPKASLWRVPAVCCVEGGHRTGAGWFRLGGRGSCRVAGFSGLTVFRLSRSFAVPGEETPDAGNPCFRGRLDSAWTTFCQHLWQCKWQLRTGFGVDAFFHHGRTRNDTENQKGCWGWGSFQPRMTRITRMTRVKAEMFWGI